MPVDPRRVKDSSMPPSIYLERQPDLPFWTRNAAGDQELRMRLNVLLAAHDLPASDLDQTLSVEVQAPEPASLIGTLIAGRYKLRQEIGEGGMGTVWVAEQSTPIKRRVALKLIKAGMDSRNVLRRFEAERQALALMTHQFIAKVFDAGTTAQGRPFFVMELVTGVLLTKFCDESKLDIVAVWNCSSPSARPSSTRIKRASSTAISSRRISWSPWQMVGRSRKSSTSAWPRRPSGLQLYRA